MRFSLLLLLFLLSPAARLCGVGHAATPPAAVRVGCELEFPPYSFVGKDGTPSGFANELISAVAQVMGMPVVFSVGSWDTIWQDLHTGRLDVLPIVAKLPGRSQAVEFSLPHTETFDAFFTREGDAPIASLLAARGKEVVVMRSDAAHHVLEGKNLAKPLTLVDTIPEGLKLVASGHHDAFLCSKLIGILEIKEHGIQGLAAGPPIPDYKRTFAFAVRKGDAELLEKLNQGLMIVKSNGTYDQIYEHWLAPHDPMYAVTKYAYPIGIGVIAVSLLAGIWVMALQMVVRRRTKELIASNTMLDKTREELEQRVEMRTAELTMLNRTLHTEIEERKRTEEQREASVEFLRLVNESAGLNDLIEKSLDFFQRRSECEAVAIRFKKDQDFPYHATRGFSPEFVAKENSLFHRDGKGQLILDPRGAPILACICGAVVRGRTVSPDTFLTEGGSFWTNSVSGLWPASGEEERPALFRGRCQCEGYESVAHIALRAGDQILGLIQLNDRRKERFSPELIKHFETLGSHLAQALSKFTAEEALKQSRDELERRVRERTEELRHRADQLARLTSELTLAEQRERRRLAQILHDHLQQLLVGAKLGLELIHRKASEGQRANVERVQEMIAESIQASRSLTVELSPPILHDSGLADGLAWLVRWKKEKYHLDVALETEPIPDALREDLKILLFQAVRELLFNVVKHAGVSQARVRLGMSDDRTAIRIVVADQGAGFDPKMIAADKKHALRGFGLFSIQERLALLGGVLEIESEPGRGSRFTLTAPLRHPLAASLTPADQRFSRGASPARESVPAPANQSGTPTIRVLLVDDHPVMRHGLAQLLAEEPELTIVGEAADGIEAIEQARALRPDLILMDFSMPNMDGVAATRAIHEELPQIRIVGLTMYEEADRASAMKEAGASAFVTKSAKPADILSTIIYLFR